MSYKSLVIGYGSIGQRHERILSSLGCPTAVVSRRELNLSHSYKDIRTAIEKEDPEYIVIANETVEHENTLQIIEDTGYDRKLLVEKPIFSFSTQRTFSFSSLYIGYNLRFHPILQHLFHRLINKKVLSVNAYVGQYLPNWRPQSDYSKSYSANQSKGGGVIRDLSHELDYLQFLFGDWKELVALGGKFSNLEINSDDSFSLLYSTEKAPTISLTMNYLDLITQRFLIINTINETYKVDFIKNKLTINDETIKYDVGRDDTYIKQHLAVFNNESEFLCSYDNGIKIIKMIEMAECSSSEKVWIKNEQENMFNMCKRRV
ncbi:Gfo/Idh/MocA family protein [Litchfieldia salsa]|uniref:Predicted dehydrogenase n=1 Tax=Litchfieldia salsa TaxID=930152 RepID=A0A1H0WDK0_9BACI|nr:oxidoreductase [Litchfieldia salsa]SDP88772.1 Predicted dehydrogenase [Litchfieldia salsa]